VTGHPDQRWARQDANLVGVMVIVLLGSLLVPALFYVSVGIAALAAVVLLVRYLRRRRRWRTQPPGEFWADRVKE
jgi:O-antigen/teichoic acid export membrane protein